MELRIDECSEGDHIGFLAGNDLIVFRMPRPKRELIITSTWRENTVDERKVRRTLMEYIFTIINHEVLHAVALKIEENADFDCIMKAPADVIGI